MLVQPRSHFILMLIIITLLLCLSVAKGWGELHRLALEAALSEVEVRIDDAEREELSVSALAGISLDVPDFLPAFFLDVSERASYNTWMAYANKSESEAWVTYNNEALRYIEIQQKQRPLDSSLVIQKANIMWRMGAEHDEVLEQYRFAIRIGKFEKYTLTNTLIFYLSIWPDINNDDRKVAVSYLLDMKRYKMEKWQYDHILKMPLIGQRACAIYSFNNMTPYYCR